MKNNKEQRTNKTEWAFPCSKSSILSASYLPFIFILFYLLIFICSCANPLVIQILDPSTASFETNGGSYVENQIVYKDYPIKRPPNPSRGGHTFDAWYIDNGTFQKQWDFITIPTSDITLYANWWEHSASLIERGGQPISNVTVQNGRSFTLSAAGGYTDYRWTLNGTVVGTGQSYTFDTLDKETSRNYTIGLIVQKDGKYYFANVTVKIEG